MAQISMKKIITDVPLFILLQNIIVKKQPNYFFHMTLVDEKEHPLISLPACWGVHLSILEEIKQE
ncbi:hypothetical protein TVAG_131320 [Trichomonas vaginalis G3]|uniref:Uncharacterized protein n=1 Tax=Trichomonas vaginalis (strain ATCC PRA-98 / G3) TaxID=412133 RepID=A2EPQ5_TRIV3|nr:hypothetical protein TVAGG3_0603580 [Trichomonas vaginalis G3]EAY05398.1 hypothetical protein TVAG_131320 [Trichomonas vaginalis G3]KAI5524087.1 hypothetical protein TVAGG3_0603580 [Trichomonas vaginalis G3]|eukprot:XP_001317621.1 hypothetical protein [Trichomonas vaginalis G3]